MNRQMDGIECFIDWLNDFPSFNTAGSYITIMHACSLNQSSQAVEKGIQPPPIHKKARLKIKSSGQEMK